MFFQKVSIFLMIWSVFTSNYILMEFVLGMLLGLLYTNKKKIFINNFLVLGLAIVGFVFTVMIDDLNGRGVLRLFFYGVPSFFILHGCVWIKQAKINLLTYIGDSSYSIYLIQVFTIPAFFKMMRLCSVSLFYSDIFVVFSVIITSCAGMLLYFYYEKKIYKLLSVGQIKINIYKTLRAV